MVWVNRVSVECHWSYQYWDFLKENSILTLAVNCLKTLCCLNMGQTRFYDFGELFASGSDLIQWNSVCLLDWHSNFPLARKQILLTKIKQDEGARFMYGVTRSYKYKQGFFHILSFREKLSFPASLVLPRK